MKRYLLAVLFLLSCGAGNAQIKAITETGDEVLLFQDGTWAYVNDSTATVAKEIMLNPTEFVKGKKSTFLVKSKKLSIGIWIDPNQWSFSKGSENDASEFQFQKKGDDLYAMFISEKIQVPLETLKGIALENARSAAPDIKLIREEYRMVNGLKVLQLQMTGTIQGMKFTYFGYYYSNQGGTIQLITYTAENLMKGYQEDIELFLNGLTEL